jgi:hypothetical protein
MWPEGRPPSPANPQPAAALVAAEHDINALAMMATSEQICGTALALALLYN